MNLLLAVYKTISCRSVDYLGSMRGGPQRAEGLDRGSLALDSQRSAAFEGFTFNGRAHADGFAEISAALKAKGAS